MRCSSAIGASVPYGALSAYDEGLLTMERVGVELFSTAGCRWREGWKGTRAQLSLLIFCPIFHVLTT